MTFSIQWLLLIFVSVLSAIYWSMTMDYSAESIAYPRMIMVALFLVALVGALRGQDKFKINNMVRWFAASYSARLLALTFAFIPLFYFTGFAIASIAFLVAAFFTFKLRGIIIPLVSLATVASLYIVFALVLGVPL
ncbi:MAG: tripartite tricarboxylate transporter TctB family protein [Devosiaceae bacterium]|nr:tripartite tricarboxylate transporter TctB family protein [Devosiaceae bacterium]